MPMRPVLLAMSALLCIGASTPASAQVYKCWSKGSVLYSQQPCSKRAVNTDPADVPVKPNPAQVDRRRAEQNRVMARAMRPLPGESTEQFETRRRRSPLMSADRAECARLDTRMPVEEASLTNPDKAEAMKAEASLGESRKRFSELKC
jgi:hypothetical protein